jgi:hypothetical protein
VDYEYSWKEMSKWLNDSIHYLEERKPMVSGREYQRIKSKLEGMKVVQHYMNNSEKIHRN